MGKEKRFVKVYAQGTVNVTEIWVDRRTGVNYVFHAGGYAGGMPEMNVLYLAAGMLLPLCVRWVTDCAKA